MAVRWMAVGEAGGQAMHPQRAWPAFLTPSLLRVPMHSLWHAVLPRTAST